MQDIPAWFTQPIILLTWGTHLAAIIYLPLLSPHITVTLPLYAMTNKICPIVQIYSVYFFLTWGCTKLHISVRPADWKISPPSFFLPSCCVCWVHVCRVGNMLTVKHIRARNFKKNKETELSFRAIFNTSPYSANTHASRGIKDWILNKQCSSKYKITFPPYVHIFDHSMAI